MTYTEQAIVGDKLLDAYKNAQSNNYPPALIIAPPQAGKTGAVIDGCEKIKVWNDTDPSRYLNGQPRETIIFWIGPSDCEIRDQSLYRIIGEPQNSNWHNITNYDIGSAILKNGKGSLMGKADVTGQSWMPRIYHMPDLLDSGSVRQDIIDLFNYHKKAGNYIIVVMDEAHIGNGMSNKKNKKLQVIPDFFVKQLGFFPGFEDSRDNIFTILVSATPGSYIFYAAERNLAGKGQSYRYIKLGIDNNYNSFEKMYNAPCYLGGTRLKPAFIVDNDLNFINFENRVLEPIVYNGREDYFIIRADGINGAMYRNLEKCKSKYNYEIRIYRSDSDKQIKKGNKNCYTIKQLDIDLRTKPDKKVICVIFGSYLQGKSFSTLEHLGGWWDRMSKKTTVTYTIQSAGRNCGRKGSWRDDNGKLFRERDFRVNYDYPVYIDMGEDEINYYTIQSFFSNVDVENWKQLEEDWISPPNNGQSSAISGSKTRILGRKNKVRWVNIQHLFQGISAFPDEAAALKAVYSKGLVKQNSQLDVHRSLNTGGDNQHDYLRLILDEEEIPQKKDAQFLLINIGPGKTGPGIQNSAHRNTTSEQEFRKHPHYSNTIGKVIVYMLHTSPNVSDKSVASMWSYKDVMGTTWQPPIATQPIAPAQQAVP